MRKTMKKMFICLLVLSFVFHFSLPAETNANANLDFSDVSINWSYKYISKLAALGVISGRGDGTFAPNDSVTHQEVLIMAIQLMNESEEAIEQGRMNVLPAGLEVSEWAKGHVGLALQRGLINIDEELASNDSDADKAWGSRNASREWVAKVTIRAIGKELQADILADQTVTFADREQITPGFEGYINAAVQLGIVSGMPGNVFNPIDPVTRAQMAVFLSRAEEYLEEKSEHVLIGHLLEVDEYSAELQDTSGGVYALEFNDSTKYFSHEVNDAPIDPSELQPYITVYVIHEHGKVQYIEIIDDQPTVSVETLQGALLDVDDSFEEITLWVDGKYEIFSYNHTTKVVGLDGESLDVDDLEMNSIVKVKVIENNDRTIQEIEVLDIPINKQSEGTVLKIDRQEGTIDIDDKNSKEEEQYLLAEDVELTYGSRTIEMDDIQEGDFIEYRVDDSVVTGIVLIEPVEPMFELVSGVLMNINPKERVLLIRTADGSLLGYDIAQNVKVVMEGRVNPDLEDLEISDQVQLSINESNDGKVEKIEIMNRSIMTVARAELVTFVPQTKSFVVILPGEEKSSIFHMNADTVVDQVVNHDVEFIEQIYTPGRTIDLTFTNDRLMRVAISNHYDGTISHIDHTNRIIHLDSSEFGTLKFPWTTSTMLETGKSNARITDFVIGDRARVTFEGSQSYAGRIQLIHDTAYRLVDVYPSSNEIIVQDGREEKSLRLTSSVPVTGVDGRRVALADLPLNSTIHVSYVGTNIIAVHVPKVELGKITNIDTVRESLTIETYDRSVITFDLTDLRDVALDASTRDGSLQDLRVGDRVEVATDKEGRIIITRFSLEYRTFWKYDSRSRAIEFRKKTLSEQSLFVLTPDVSVHDGTNSISLTSLKDGDEMAVYFLNRKIMELEKR